MAFVERGNYCENLTSMQTVPYTYLITASMIRFTLPSTTTSARFALWPSISWWSLWLGRTTLKQTDTAITLGYDKNYNNSTDYCPPQKD